MNITNILVAIASILFFMIGTDKFLYFLQPPCSLQDSIPGIIWFILGGMQLSAAVMIWLPRHRWYIAGFFLIVMIIFTIIHLANGTYDIGGSTFMAVILGLLVWNPEFIRRKWGQQ